MGKLIWVSFVCLSSSLFAQKSFFGVEAGVNVANQRMEVPFNHSSNSVIQSGSYKVNNRTLQFTLIYKFKKPSSI